MSNQPRGQTAVTARSDPGVAGEGVTGEGMAGLGIVRLRLSPSLVARQHRSSLLRFGRCVLTASSPTSNGGQLPNNAVIHPEH